MPATQLACTLYTLREYTRTAATIVRTLAKVKEIGYSAVQFSGLGPIEAEELAKILNGEGLTCCASHVSLPQLRDNPQKVIDDHKLWGCSHIAIGGLNPRNPVTQTWLDFADEYNSIAKKMEGSGIKLGYHTHSNELAKYDGKVALQILLEHFRPEIWIELDVYWITAGGGDPAQWIGKLKNRVPCIHMKDMAVRPDRTQLFAEVGEGNLNWEAIIAAGKASGVQWYIVEQDNCYGQSPFDCIERSLKNMKAWA
jgi:sugar phosphate isomerase/epimerase